MNLSRSKRIVQNGLPDRVLPESPRPRSPDRTVRAGQRLSEPDFHAPNLSSDRHATRGRMPLLLSASGRLRSHRAHPCCGRDSGARHGSPRVDAVHMQDLGRASGRDGTESEASLAQSRVWSGAVIDRGATARRGLTEQRFLLGTTCGKQATGLGRFAGSCERGEGGTWGHQPTSSRWSSSDCGRSRSSSRATASSCASVTACAGRSVSFVATRPPRARQAADAPRPDGGRARGAARGGAPSAGRTSLRSSTTWRLTGLDGGRDCSGHRHRPQRRLQRDLSACQRRPAAAGTEGRSPGRLRARRRVATEPASISGPSTRACRSDLRSAGPFPVAVALADSAICPEGRCEPSRFVCRCAAFT